jgi:hypothetical protein
MSIVKTFQVLVRVTVGATFLYAAVSKLLHGNPTQEETTIFAEWSHNPCARYGLIAAEMILAAWLFSGFKVNVAGIVTVVLVSAFTSLLILEIKKGHPRPCGCAGTQLVTTDPNQIRVSLRTDLGRNAILMTFAGLLFLSAREHESAPMSLLANALPVTKQSRE